MGAGIAQVAAQFAKIPQVLLFDQSRKQLDAQTLKLKESLERSKQKGLLNSEDVEQTMSAIKTTTNIEDLGGSDFFIEVHIS